MRVRGTDGKDEEEKKKNESGDVAPAFLVSVLTHCENTETKSHFLHVIILVT